MKLEIEIPDGFTLKGLHHFGKTNKGADTWWAYVGIATPEPNEFVPGGKYYHFQGGQGFSIQDAVNVASQNLTKSLEARKRPPTGLPSIKLDLSSILKGLPSGKPTE